MPLLAHAGGIPELLFAVVPVAVFLVVWRIARGRSDSEGRGDRPSAGRKGPRP